MGWATQKNKGAVRTIATFKPDAYMPAADAGNYK